MADSESIKQIINQVAIQAAMAAMMACRDSDTISQPATTRNQQETQRQRHWGLILEKPKFNWGTQERCIEPLNF